MSGAAETSRPAVGKLDPDRMAQIVKGISDGCCDANCALLGGETAEMPDFYKPREFDMAGFCVGVVEKGRLIVEATVAGILEQQTGISIGFFDWMLFALPLAIVFLFISWFYLNLMIK